MKKSFFLGLVTLLTSFAAVAGDCVITIDRTPCPGQEAAARKPYDGKNPTEEKSVAKTAAECDATAEKASKVVRKKTLSKKVVTGIFDGKPLAKPFTGMGDCK